MSKYVAYNELAAIRDAIISEKINRSIGRRLAAKFLPFIENNSRIAEFFIVA